MLLPLLCGPRVPNVTSASRDTATWWKWPTLNWGPLWLFYCPKRSSDVHHNPQAGIQRTIAGNHQCWFGNLITISENYFSQEALQKLACPKIGNCEQITRCWNDFLCLAKSSMDRLQDKGCVWMKRHDPFILGVGDIGMPSSFAEWYTKMYQRLPLVWNDCIRWCRNDAHPYVASPLYLTISGMGVQDTFPRAKMPPSTWRIMRYSMPGSE